MTTTRLGLNKTISTEELNTSHGLRIAHADIKAELLRHAYDKHLVPDWKTLKYIEGYEYLDDGTELYVINARVDCEEATDEQLHRVAQETERWA